MANRLLSLTLSISASPSRFATFIHDQIFQKVITSNTIATCRTLQISSRRFGLEEFFDDPKTYGEPVIKSGRPWRADELRLKSNQDLHKLWFVLYKERNMLYTMQEAAKVENESFPSPERIDKVEISMANIEEVVMERNKAYWQLEVSPCITGTRPAAFRRDKLGINRWQYCSQHLAPYHKNRAWRECRGPGDTEEVSGFFRRYREMKMREHNKFRSRTARHIRDIFRRFPDADADHIAELHPELPPGYVQHLKDNVHLYIHDPPRNRKEGTVHSAVIALGKVEEKLLK